MKKREYISLLMAITMMMSAASCGSADNGASAADVKPDTFGASELNGAAKDDAPAEKSEETAVTHAAAEAAKAEAADDAAGEADVGADAMYRADFTAKADGAGEGSMGDIAAKKKVSAHEIEAAEGKLPEEPAAAPVEDMPEPDIATTAAEPDITAEPEPEVKLPEAGQLTAGEWNDNENWGFFSNLVTAGTIAFPSFSLDPTGRIAVDVKTDDGEPAVNAKVRLISDSGKTIWSSLSDKNGRAYLFSGSDTPVSIEAELNGVKQSIDFTAADESGQGASAKGGTAEITLSAKSKLYDKTEVMFIVDTTGSMVDEMLFLQSEFSAITRAVGSDNIQYAVSFYRDEGDEYVTKHSGFTSDVDELQKTINNEQAMGGGDYPEAVAQVLTETITDGTWSEDSAKIAFLIFDAPPHEGTDKELKAAAKAASEKGIHLVPVVSSDSDRDTELFARSLAIMTNGTYVFLTDDSGIGGSHLEPIIGDYKVEKLYDIIIRVIDNYRQKK